MTFGQRLAGARPDLLRQAGRLCAKSDAEDLVQDTLARAMRFEASFDGKRAIGPWLASILVRLHVDRLRRQAKQAESESRLDLPPAAGCDMATLDADEQVAHLLEHLDEPGRSLLRRFHQDGESIRELSRAFKLPEGSIKSHLHRARRHLAARFTLDKSLTINRRNKS